MNVQMKTGGNKDKKTGRGDAGGLGAYLPQRLFKALSDPKRLSIFVRLAEKRVPCTVGEIAEGTNVDLSVVSRHLAILREAGIIECVKQGKEVRCCVRAATLSHVLRTIADAIDKCCPNGCPEGDSKCSGGDCGKSDA